AVEGALRGAAGIACSLAPRAEDPARAIKFAAAVVRAAVGEPMPAGTVLNVNMPRTPSDGYQWTVLGRRLYADDVSERRDPRGREPARGDEAVADNAAMVMTDCARAPAKVTACIAAVATVAELEARCLIPIDNEGTEGDRFAR